MSTETITRSFNEQRSDSLEFIRSLANPVSNAEKYKERINEVSTYVRNLDYSFLRAMDFALMLDPELRNEVNFEFKQRNLPTVEYGLTARLLLDEGRIDEKTFVRAGGKIDTITNPGGGNFLQVTVSDVLTKRIDQLGQVKATVDVYDLTNDGDLKLPTYGAFATTTSFLEDGTNTVPNLGTTVEGGISSITLSPQAHGGYLPVLNAFVRKLSGRNFANLVDILAEAFARGLDTAILSANGTSPNVTGMLQNATSVTATADPLADFMLLVKNVSDTNRGGLKNLMGYMNTATWAHFQLLAKALPNNRAGIVDIANQTIFNVPIVVTDVLLTTGTAGSKTAPVCVGYSKLYKFGMTGVEVKTDEFSGFLTNTINLKQLAYIDGKPAFSSAFAKTTVANGL